MEGQLNIFDLLPQEKQEGVIQSEDENAEYEKFEEKFKPKKTTDDCYTPPEIYEVVASWVEKEYGVSRKNFVRPFYPGGDFENYDYKEEDIVVDNPPFSILSKICRFYNERNIPYFLFCPGLTVMCSAGKCKVCTGSTIVYENGACVNTSFLTNLESAGIRTAPDLYKALKDIQGKMRRAKELPKYDYPKNVMTAIRLGYLSQCGQYIKFEDANIERIKRVDAQKTLKKEIYGGGYLIGDKDKERYLQAQTQTQTQARKVLVFELSEREKEIIKKLDSNKENGGPIKNEMDEKGTIHETPLGD